LTNREQTHHDMGQTIELLGDWSSEQMHESSLPEMLHRFVTNVRNFASGTVWLGSFRYQDAEGSVELSSDLEIIPPAWRMSSSDLMGLKKQVLAECSQKNIGRQGMTDIVKDQYVNHMVFLGEPADRILVVRLSAQNQRDAQALAILNFLVRQLQLGYRWINRIENAEKLLYRDDLTGMYNNRYLNATLDREIIRAERFGGKFCLFFIDLDNLKLINDEHGHLTGTKVIREVAKILAAELREVDSVVRYGGDEFIVILLSSDASAGVAVAERIRKRVERYPFMTDQGIELSLTCSIGVATFPDHARCKEQLMHLADDSMYQGKRSGKNKVMVSQGTPTSEGLS
jgi:diguanylate cyclase (GGDEF)-like protein